MALCHGHGNRLPLVVPRFERFQQLDDLVSLALAHFVDAHAARLHVVVEQEIEELEEAVELIIIRTGWKRAVGDGRRGRLAAHGFCYPKEAEPVAQLAVGVSDTERWRQMGVCPVDETCINAIALEYMRSESHIAIGVS